MQFQLDAVVGLLKGFLHKEIQIVRNNFLVATQFVSFFTKSIRAPSHEEMTTLSYDDEERIVSN